MPRRRRLTLAGNPHHVTQRGSRRQDVFFCREDRNLYLDYFGHYTKKFEVQVLAYCLMTNHVHHLLVPARVDSIRWAVQMTHKRYAEQINKRQKWKGHLWQERYYSSVVDDQYFWIALRYIERNPVNAGLTDHPAKYHWSSAAAHCRVRKDPLLTSNPGWVQKKSRIDDWHSWLSEPDGEEEINHLRVSTSRDLPCGSETFLSDLENQYGIPVRAGAVGRPKNT